MQLKQLTQCYSKKVWSDLYVIKSKSHEAKQHCFVISEKKNTNIDFVHFILIIIWIKLNTHFLPHWNLQKKAIIESGGMMWCDLRCYTKTGKVASLKSTMSI